MDVEIKLYRPYDREPSDHFYGEKFDSEMNLVIGGKSNWSPSPEAGTCEEHPAAKIKDKDITIELHEDGPVISFVLACLEKLPSATKYPKSLACSSVVSVLISLNFRGTIK